MKNNPALAEEQVSNLSVKLVNRTAASVVQFEKYILLRAYSRITYRSKLCEHKQKLHIAY